MTLAPARSTCALLRVLIAIVLLSTLALGHRPAVSLPQRPISEDGFYALCVARNIATGHGITIDGSTLTNGFQPLFTFLCVPCFWIAGDDTNVALRCVLVLHWIVYAAAGWLMGRIVGGVVPEVYRKLASLAGTLIYLCSAYLFWLHFNGLETGFVLLMYLAIARYHQTRRLDTVSGIAGLGVLLGLLVLTRIDTIFVVMCYSVLALVSPTFGSDIRQRIRQMIILGALAMLISSPWWIYNRYCFGAVFPTSGTAQQKWELSGERIKYALHALATCAGPIVSVFDTIQLPYILLRAVVGIIAWAIFSKAWRSVEFATVLETHGQDAGATLEIVRLRAKQSALVLLGTFAILVCWYTLSSWAWHFYRRYFSPLSLLATFVESVSFAWLLVRIPRVASALAAAACVLIVALVAVMCMPKYNRSLPFDQVELVAQHVPADATVAAFQSGTLGFFRTRVVNLDGKVNVEALRRRNDIASYLDDKSIDWICDWPEYVDKAFNGSPEKAGWVYVNQVGHFKLYHRAG